jgi:hypothetical protein
MHYLSSVLLLAAMLGREPSFSQYLMNTNAEVALARSAAPPSISRDATILVLTAHGYVVARNGTDGFVCMVDRSWDGPFDWPEYWNPRIRAAGCMNSVTARTIVPMAKLRARLAIDGKLPVEIANAVKTAFADGEIPAMRSGGVCYMMSARSYLTDAPPHNMAHIMFYFPISSDVPLGAGVAGSPIMAEGSLWYQLTPTVRGLPPIQVTLIGANTWSDGSKGPAR